MWLCLENRWWPQKQNQRLLKQGHKQFYHRQLHGRLKSERQKGLLQRINGRKAAADLRTVVLNRKIVTTYRLFRSNGQNNHPRRLSTKIAEAEPTAMTQADSDIGSERETIPALSGDLDRNPRDPSTSNPGDQPMPAPGKKKGTSEKARLVSYTSQEHSQDETGSVASRRSRKNERR